MPAVAANQHDRGAAVRSDACAAVDASASSTSMFFSGSSSTPSAFAYQSIQVRLPRVIVHDAIGATCGATSVREISPALINSIVQTARGRRACRCR